MADEPQNPAAPPVPHDTEQANTGTKTYAERRVEAYLIDRYGLPLPNIRANAIDAGEVPEFTEQEAIAVAQGTAEPSSWAMAAAARKIVQGVARFAKLSYGVEQSKTVTPVGEEDEFVA